MNWSGGRVLCTMFGISCLLHCLLFLNTSSLEMLTSEGESNELLRIGLAQHREAATKGKASPLESLPQSLPDQPSFAPESPQEEATVFQAPEEKNKKIPEPEIKNPGPEKEKAVPDRKKTPLQREKKTSVPPSEKKADQPPTQAHSLTSPKRDTLSAPTVAHSSASGSLDPDRTSSSDSAQRGQKKVPRSSFEAADGPRFRTPLKPLYPRMAQRRGLEGEVLLELTISDAGRLLGVKVLRSSGDVFSEAALAAVRKASFYPASDNGTPRTSVVLLPVRFTLRKS